MQASQPERVAAGPLRFRRGDPLRRWTVIVLAVCVLLFGWSLVADRLTPYTSDASVRAFVVRIVPEVSGKVVEVSVHDNQIVRAGDLLYRIDPTPFGIAVERAEAKLAAAGQAVGASTAAVDEAQAQLVQELDLGAAPAQCRCDPVNEIRRRLRIGDGLGRRQGGRAAPIARAGTVRRVRLRPLRRGTGWGTDERRASGTGKRPHHYLDAGNSVFSAPRRPTAATRMSSSANRDFR